MITKNMVKEGYKKGIIKLIPSPNYDGIVCKIGDYWFYFGGITAEECDDVDEYKSVVLESDIVNDIYEVLNDFFCYGDCIDEYVYYEHYLKEHGIKED